MMRARAGGGGGIAARRAVARWAVRLFRRDWRQQRLIIAMMIFAVAVAVFGVSAEGAPQRVNGHMAAAKTPGLGIRPRMDVLGSPVVLVE